MKWTRCSKVFFFCSAFWLLLGPLSFAQVGPWDAVVSDLEVLRAKDPVVVERLVLSLQGVLESYDRLIQQQDSRLQQKDSELLRYDLAYRKALGDLKISYLVEGGLGALALGALVWALIEHLVN